MADDELRRWITENYRAGYAREQVKRALYEQGYDPLEADRAVDEVYDTFERGVSPRQPSYPQASAPQLGAPQKRRINWKLVGVVVVLGLTFGVFIIFTNIVNSLIQSATSLFKP